VGIGYKYMDESLIHYEVLVTRNSVKGWSIDLVSENRDHALDHAISLFEATHTRAVKVSKEVFSLAEGTFSGCLIFNKSKQALEKKPDARPHWDNVCTSPSDLYTVFAREKIADLLSGWLHHYGVTPFELLHSAELAKKLEASGNELRHIIQKLSIPEVEATKQSVHEIMRRWTNLIDRSITRVIQDGHKGLFPSLDADKFLLQIKKLKTRPDRDYVLGGSIALTLASLKTAEAKLEWLLGRLLDLNGEPDVHAWALSVFEMPVCEIFAQPSRLSSFIGQDQDMGLVLLVFARLTVVDALQPGLISASPKTEALQPLAPVLEGYRQLICQGHLPSLKANIIQGLMRALKSPRRLKPSNPEAEIKLLRLLALTMAGSVKDQATQEDMYKAFCDRSQLFVTADFMAQLLSDCTDVAVELSRLMLLCENVTGNANKRAAARWLIGFLNSHKFERGLREASKPLSLQLSLLAEAQKRIVRANLNDKDQKEAVQRLGVHGDILGQDAKLLEHIMRSPAPISQKLNLLLSLASGSASPVGPLSQKAQAEVDRLIKAQKAQA
jgi:hypothetical protein